MLKREDMKDLNVGDVIFYVNKMHSNPSVQYAIIEDIIEYNVYCILYEPVNCTTICGKSFKEFFDTEYYNQKWKKLPKHFNIDSLNHLGEFGYDKDKENHLKQELEKEANGFTFPSAEYIKAAIKVGYLVPKETQNYYYNIDLSKDGYKYKLEHKHELTRITLLLLSEPVFKTYEEANKYKGDYIKELYRIASLSDHEWNIEQLDKTLDKYTKSNGIPEETISKIRDDVLSYKNFDDLEFRNSSKGFEIKHIKNKRWYTYENFEFN